MSNKVSDTVLRNKELPKYPPKSFEIWLLMTKESLGGSKLEFFAQDIS